MAFRFRQVLLYKPEALISQIYTGMKLYMFRAILLPIIRSLFTVHSALVHIIQVHRKPNTYRTTMVLLERCLQKRMTYISAECTVNKLLMLSTGTARNM